MTSNIPDDADGVALIATERQRQLAEEGWTPEHDGEHDAGEMAAAAMCYACPPNVAIRATDSFNVTPRLWPWAPGWWKPSPDDRVRELVKAGALIAAEIDRLTAGGSS